MCNTEKYVHLTDAQFSAIQHLTSKLKIDEVIDITGDDYHDYFFDFDEDCEITIKEGLDLLYEAIAYEAKHDNISPEEANEIVNLMKEYKVGNDAWYKWYLS